jgi:hypothetical protein
MFCPKPRTSSLSLSLHMYATNSFHLPRFSLLPSASAPPALHCCPNWSSMAGKISCSCACLRSSGLGFAGELCIDCGCTAICCRWCSSVLGASQILATAFSSIVMVRQPATLVTVVEGRCKLRCGTTTLIELHSSIYGGDIRKITRKNQMQMSEIWCTKVKVWQRRYLAILSSLPLAYWFELTIRDIIDPDS